MVLKKYLKILPFAALTMIIVFSSFVTIARTNLAYIRASANIVDSPILIIDPGHGGEDGGAVSPNGLVESEVNLDISLKLRDVFLLFGISPVMTRESETIDYPPGADTVSSKKVADQKSRVELINSFDNAFLISIHQNTFPSSKPFGAQVLYADTQGSMEFAINLQELLILKLDPDNYRTAAQIPDTIYLMKNISCPAVLIECGFLSNPEDEKLLISDEYKLKLALTIASSYYQQNFGIYTEKFT